jgi:ASC-1-like (ASCH) protein
MQLRIVEVKDNNIMVQVCYSLMNQNVNSLHISEPWLTFIKDGIKNVEGRKGSINKFKSWVNNYAIFYNNNLRILVYVKAVRHYDTLIQYLEGEDLGNIAPHLNNDFDDILGAYHQFASDDDVERVGGFNGIAIEMIGIL